MHLQTSCIAACLLRLASASTNLIKLRVAHQERGILTLSFDPSQPPDKSLQLLTTTQAGYKPGWLHATETHLYSISRTQFPDNSSTSAGIFAFEKQSGGSLRLLDSESSHGNGGVFVDITPDRKTLASANM